MYLDILKKNEKELRRKYGDGIYEKLYAHYKNFEGTAQPAKSAIIGKETYLPPLYRDLFGEPSGIGALKTPVSKPPAIKMPQIPLHTQKIENKFYTNTENSGIIPSKPKSIEDYRKGIEDLSKKIADLNKGQYKAMLSGDYNKTASMDKFITDAEKKRDDLKVQLSRVMGIGSENKDKDMLRPTSLSGNISNKPQLAANNMQQAIGLNDGDEGYPSEPSPSPVPEPPPVEGGHPDMEKYEEEVGNYWDAHDA